MITAASGVGSTSARADIIYTFTGTPNYTSYESHLDGTIGQISNANGSLDVGEYALKQGFISNNVILNVSFVVTRDTFVDGSPAGSLVDYFGPPVGPGVDIPIDPKTGYPTSGGSFSLNGFFFQFLSGGSGVWSEGFSLPPTLGWGAISVYSVPEPSTFVLGGLALMCGIIGYVARRLSTRVTSPSRRPSSSLQP